MKKYFRALPVAITALVGHSLAQTGAALIGTAYNLPTTFVAPGQIVRLQVLGLKTVLPEDARVQRASTVPLPNTLAGVSVTITQFIHGSSLGSNSAPLVSINQAALPFTVITVQMPYRLLSSSTGSTVTTQLVISENGADNQAVTVSVLLDQAHVLTSCDREDIGHPPCQSLVTHADGTLVSWDAPAQPSEVVVIYAWGLGVGGDTPLFDKTGELTPTPGLYISTRDVSFAFMPNAGSIVLPGPLYANSSWVSQARGSVFLTPGQIGLYQINVQLPGVFPPIASCNGPEDANFSISVRAAQSIGSAAICVQAVQ